MESSAHQTRIDHLNGDILMRIFDFLDYDDKIRLQRTCTKWKYLIGLQLDRVKALRLGQFYQGGYQITSGLQLRCSEHFDANKSTHRRQTGSLFNDQLFRIPADCETQCYSVNRFDYLHRTLKQSHHSITMLSLGRLHISYRLLIVLTNNLPNLEHLELINCASKFQDSCSKRKIADRNDDSLGDAKVSLESSIMTSVIYNQHADEQMNIQDRLIRSTLVRSCNLIREAKNNKIWANMRHLLVRECHLMNEFTLSLILALTSQTLVHLEIERNQYLTGEFLNYCGSHLEELTISHCPSIRQTFVDDLVKIRKLLGSSIRFGTRKHYDSSSSSLKLTTASTGPVSSAALFAILFSA